MAQKGQVLTVNSMTGRGCRHSQGTKPSLQEQPHDPATTFVSAFFLWYALNLWSRPIWDPEALCR